jgi:hypothetical protein
MEKTENKKETLNRLFIENGLLPEDVHKHNHYTIITRMGIEKIQARNKVRAHYEAVVMDRDFCVIKGTFSKEGVPDLETFGSASKETSQNKYYAEMAEKRCLSRGVLKICKFYELGVYGEDEADDFRKKTGEAMTEPNKAPQPTQEAKPAQGKGEQPNAAQAEDIGTLRDRMRALIKRPEINGEEKKKFLLTINGLPEARVRKGITHLEGLIAERGGVPA